MTAPVTMCTLTSRRTPLMPSGSRTSSWPSMMNSCVQDVQDLLVGGDVDRLGGLDHAVDVGLADLACP
jgi:hypothetical protein